MLDNNYVGKILFEDHYSNAVQIDHIGEIKEKEYYFINHNYPEESRSYGLWDEKEMQRMLENQEKFAESREKNRLKEIECNRVQEEKARIQEEKENLYGFVDKKSPMQKQKIVNILMKTYRYDDKIISRKDHCIKLLKEGYYSKIKTYSNEYNKRAKNDTTTINGLYAPEGGSFYEVTKTEYDFFNYLKDNRISI